MTAILYLEKILMNMDHLGRVHDKINYNYGRTKSFSSYEQQYLIEE